MDDLGPDSISQTEILRSIIRQDEMTLLLSVFLPFVKTELFSLQTTVTSFQYWRTYFESRHPKGIDPAPVSTCT